MEKRYYGPFKFVPITSRPKLAWPKDARVALWIIPNVEFFALDYGMPGDENQPPDPNAKHPDVRKWSQREHGNRVGFWRMAEVLRRYDIRGTAALNSVMCDSHPEIVQAMLDWRWELMGHGQSNSKGLIEVPDDRAEIKATLDRIESFSGRRPSGWLGAGLAETWNSLDHMADLGIDYICDWVADDQPFLMQWGGRRMVSIPYSFDTNDVPIFLYKKYTVSECEALLKRQFDTLYREGERSGRVMAICLHPWVIGVAHRIGALDAALEYICGHPGVWKATGSEIVEHYLSTNPEV